MFSQRDDRSIPNNRAFGPPTAAFLYLGAEVFLTALIGLLLATLALVQRVLPKPPRDLKNDTVVVTGAGSGLGKAVAEEFSKAGCVVACVDQDLDSRQKIVSDSSSQYPRIEDLEPQSDFYQVTTRRTKLSYKCNSTNRGEILRVAKEIHRDIGHVDVLVSCVGDSVENILDIASTTLMSHYWTMLAFLPSMIQCQHSHIVAVIPATSTDDAYMGSKAAVAGIIEAISQQFSNANQLTFTTVAPKVEPRLIEQSEQQTARDIVEAVRRDQPTLTTSWGSSMIYPVCCMIHEAITSFTRWLYAQGCDNPF